jgi:ectoine hydroxylase-related dioxygenase (phytanoyl-CoA dioxygenase family)
LENFDINVLECKPGNVLIFNEDIIHGGSYNYGTTCRVSLEFTMLVDKLYARPYN